MKGSPATSEAAWTEDAFLGGRLTVLQPRHGYRAGLDAVLLAAAMPGRDVATTTVLDIGAGVGVVGLCVAARVPGARVVLLERERELVDLAERNIRRNGLADRVGAVQLDVLDAPPAQALAACGLSPGTFDRILANPPYQIEGAGRLPARRLRSVAHAMPRDGLDGWVRFAARMCARGGSLTLIHRADALAMILEVLAGRFGGVRVLPIHARAGEPAVRVIVHAALSSRAPLRLLPGLILHDDGNGFRPPVTAVLRDGEPLPLG